MIASHIFAGLVWLGAAPVSAGTAEPTGGGARRCDHHWRLTVVEAESEAPIVGARVTHRNNASESGSSTTDASGVIELHDLCPGELRISAGSPEHGTVIARYDVVAHAAEARLALPRLHDHPTARVIVVQDEATRHAAASTSMSGAQLRRVRGRPLADAVGGIAGVSVLRSAAGGIGKPIVRGQVGSRNLLLVDGIRHESQQWGLDHAPEVDPDGAGRITVIKGAATTRFGQRASGGVVLLESLPLLRTPGVSGEVGGLGSSNALGGGGSARVDYAPSRARGLAMRVDGNIGRHRAALAPDYALANTASRTWNVGGRMGYLRERYDVEVGYRRFDSRLGICDCLQISSPREFESRISSRRPLGFEDARARFAIRRPEQRVVHHLASARARVAIGDVGELHALYAFQFDDRREYARVRANVSGPQLRLRLGTHTGELRFEHDSIPLGRWSLEGSSGVAIGQQGNRIDSANTLVPDYRQLSWGVYHVQRFVHRRAELEAGLRYDGSGRRTSLRERDYLGQSATGRLDEANCRGAGDGGTCLHVFHVPSATIGGLVRPFAQVPELSFAVKLDSSGRAPAIDEQFMNGAAPSFPIIGAGDGRLGVERTWGGEATARYRTSWLTVEGSAHASYVDDYIAFAPAPQEGECAPLTCTIRGPFAVFEFQATDARFYGGELQLELRAPRLPLSLAATSAWVRARDLGTRGFLPLIPTDRYTVTGRWDWPHTGTSTNGHVELGGTVVARQRRADPELDFAPPPPAYALVSAAIGVDFPGRHHVVHTSIVGNNLLNARYRDYTSLLRYFADEPGWSVQLRVSIEFAVAARGPAAPSRATAARAKRMRYIASRQTSRMGDDTSGGEQ